MQKSDGIMARAGLLYWPDVKTPQGLIIAIKSGWMGAIILCGMTILATVLNYSNYSDEMLWGQVITICILAICGFGISRKSRIASIGILIFYGIIISYTVFFLGGKVGIAPLFFLFFLNSVRGTFAYHKSNPKVPDIILTKKDWIN